MDRMIEGFRRFRETYFETNRPLFRSLVEGGQSPSVLLIGCSDSRVDPGMIFESQPGEMFVIRNVANLIPPFCPSGSLHGTSAAIEFAVRTLKVDNVVVLGHAQCGGVRALLDDTTNGGSDFISQWMNIARTARDRALALTLSAGQPLEIARRFCEQETVAISIANLMTFPWVRERVQDGSLRLHGWYFDLEHGELWKLDPKTNTFVQI